MQGGNRTRLRLISQSGENAEKQVLPTHRNFLTLQFCRIVGTETASKRPYLHYFMIGRDAPSDSKQATGV